MDSLGTRGLFACAVIAVLIAAAQVGWPAVIGLFLLVAGYLSFLGKTNRKPSRRRRR